MSLLLGLEIATSCACGGLSMLASDPADLNHGSASKAGQLLMMMGNRTFCLSLIFAPATADLIWPHN